MREEFLWGKVLQQIDEGTSAYKISHLVARTIAKWFENPANKGDVGQYYLEHNHGQVRWIGTLLVPKYTFLTLSCNYHGVDLSKKLLIIEMGWPKYGQTRYIIKWNEFI
jgi:hypothetical protein